MYSGSIPHDFEFNSPEYKKLMICIPVALLWDQNFTRLC